MFTASSSSRTPYSNFSMSSSTFLLRVFDLIYTKWLATERPKEVALASPDISILVCLWSTYSWIAPNASQSQADSLTSFLFLFFALADVDADVEGVGRFLSSSESSLSPWCWLSSVRSDACISTGASSVVDSSSDRSGLSGNNTIGMITSVNCHVKYTECSLKNNYYS